MGRQAFREEARQTDKQAGRHSKRKRDRQAGRQRRSNTGQTDRQTDRQTETDRGATVWKRAREVKRDEQKEESAALCLLLSLFHLLGRLHFFPFFASTITEPICPLLN